MRERGIGRERPMSSHYLRRVSILFLWPEEVRSYDNGNVVGAHLGQVSVERELLKKRHKEPNGT